MSNDFTVSIKSNFHKFFESVLKDEKKFDEKAVGIVKTVAIQALSDLQRMSPVDFGRYRAGHILSIDIPSGESPEAPTVQEQKAHRTGSPAGKYVKKTMENQANATDLLDGIKRFIGTLSIFITNNLNYAMFIELGTYSKDPNAPKKLYEKARQLAEKRLRMLTRGAG